MFQWNSVGIHPSSVVHKQSPRISNFVLRSMRGIHKCYTAERLRTTALSIGANNRVLSCVHSPCSMTDLLLGFSFIFCASISPFKVQLSFKISQLIN